MIEGKMYLLVKDHKSGGCELAAYAKRTEHEGPLLFPSEREASQYRRQHLDERYRPRATTADRLVTFLYGRRRWQWIWVRRVGCYEALRLPER